MKLEPELNALSTSDKVFIAISIYSVKKSFLLLFRYYLEYMSPDLQSTSPDHYKKVKLMLIIYLRDFSRVFKKLWPQKLIFNW